MLSLTYESWCPICFEATPCSRRGAGPSRSVRPLPRSCAGTGSERSHAIVTYRWMRAAARRCEWMIDVGAGHGELCLFFLKHSRARPVVAIEPQASERELMRRNLALNGCESSEALVWVSKLIGLDDGPEFVPLAKLPVDNTRHGFIKIDVDGADMDVLRSGETMLATTAVDLLVEPHSLPLEQECLS